MTASQGVIYCSDESEISEQAQSLLDNMKFFILNVLDKSYMNLLGSFAVDGVNGLNTDKLLKFISGWNSILPNN